MRPLVLLLLAGCMTVPAARPIATATLVIPPIAATPREPLVLAEGAPVPHGCFARSAQGDSVACVVGQWSSGDDPVKLVVFRSDASSLAPIELTGSVLTGRARDAVNELLRTGDFGTLDDAPVRLGVGSERWFHRLLVKLEERAQDDPLVLRTTVRLDAPPAPPPPAPHGDPETIEPPGPDPVLWANSLADVACENASLAVRELSVRTLLVERECRSGDAVYLAATVCNAELAQCD